MINKAESLTVGFAISQGAQELQAADVPEPRRQAGSLLAHLLDRDRSFVIAHADDALAAEDCAAFQSLIKRRASGEPLQYITGHQEFFKLDFEVTPDVLIPRPETELIVEAALEILQNEPEPYFADIGTGSGCVAISILHEVAAARAVAVDLSPRALAVAQRNAQRHHVEDRVEFVESDLFSAIEPEERLGMIVSNPPYVTDAELKVIQREVSYEPRAALAAGPDGLMLIRRLLQASRPLLRQRGHLIFEIGFGQEEAVRSLIDQRLWKLLDVRVDLQVIARTFVLQGK